MHFTVTFREVTDPAKTAETGKYDWSGTFSYFPIGGIPIGGLVRFAEDFETYLRLHFPDFHLGDDLNVYHPVLAKEVVDESIRKIRYYCIGWPGYNELDKTPL